MKTYDCPQYSPEYWQAKLGVPSASNFHRIFTATTRKLSSQIDDYICELIAERLNPSPPFFTERPGHTVAMRNGLNCEPDARRFYEVERNLDVRQIGFLTTEDGLLGCSPDGLVGEEGGLELKCPELKTHLGYLLKGKLPNDYIAQVHGPLAMAILDPTVPFKWWDFMSYHPDARPLLVRVEPNDYTEELAAALKIFLKKFDDAVGYIEGRSLVPALESSIAAQNGGRA